MTQVIWTAGRQDSVAIGSKARQNESNRGAIGSGRGERGQGEGEPRKVDSCIEGRQTVEGGHAGQGEGDQSGREAATLPVPAVALLIPGFIATKASGRPAAEGSVAWSGHRADPLAGMSGGRVSKGRLPRSWGRCRRKARDAEAEAGGRWR